MRVTKVPCHVLLLRACADEDDEGSPPKDSSNDKTRLKHANVNALLCQTCERTFKAHVLEVVTLAEAPAALAAAPKDDTAMVTGCQTLMDLSKPDEVWSVLWSVS